MRLVSVLKFSFSLVLDSGTRDEGPRRKRNILGMSFHPVGWSGHIDGNGRPNMCVMVFEKKKINTIAPQRWEFAAAGLYFTVLFYHVQDLSSPPAPGCLQHQMSCCQRQSKSDKHTSWTSEENLTACSSAISAQESSYKKHLLHFVLSMMLWKINTGMVCLPLVSLTLCASVHPYVCTSLHVSISVSVFW